MTEAKPNLFTRHDTFFGVCEGLGQDLGFNPNILRVLFAMALLVSPKLVLLTYLGLGVLVFATRWFFPSRGNRAQSAQAEVQPAGAANDEGTIALAKAA